ncbi:MAG: hypothetical protein KIIPBIDF_00797 [Candidatus Methanoperedenaceae archaeon GB50]|nr:MAG: hypothetical protein KIIPBIDF_00797 [Candidatus Methanoperedenaceae archaeon GB50]
MSQNIETDLEKIQELARQKEEKNWEFRLFLKDFAHFLQKKLTDLCIS